MTVYNALARLGRREAAIDPDGESVPVEPSPAACAGLAGDALACARLAGAP